MYSIAIKTNQPQVEIFGEKYRHMVCVACRTIQVLLNYHRILPGSTDDVNFWRPGTILHTRKRSTLYIHSKLVSINKLCSKLLAGIKEEGGASHIRTIQDLTKKSARISKKFWELLHVKTVKSWKWDTDGLWTRLEKMRNNVQRLSKEVEIETQRLFLTLVLGFLIGWTIESMDFLKVNATPSARDLKRPKRLLRHQFIIAMTGNIRIFMGL
ncbi:hypothetical protein BT96DRAFT_939246 [Gymnopus androsaceus JB14]|uniref:Uncharacterized protein n=1 Tax=Gymnopus androsaceus JB14 TaxID=1447944 RepID=A0A6A4HML1_9AGAR|nr:hypothetical protein BT96DRAFT_939246 [Gymnopus androsaceus JB14]